MNKKDIIKDEGTSSIIYILGAVLGIIMLAIIITFLANSLQMKKNDSISKNRQSKETKIILDTAQTESASKDMGKTVEEAKDELEKNNTEQTVKEIQEDKNIVQNTTSQGEITQADSKEVKKEETKTKFIYPVQGEIINEYAKDNLIYSITLDEWITHTGVDIKADKTAVVKSACDGTVAGIKNDPRFGLTVIIEHENGYKTVYSNLLTAEFVNEGDRVDAGETIGTVGDSSVFESAEEPHVHFEILKDNEYQDPMILLGELIEE